MRPAREEATNGIDALCLRVPDHPDLQLHLNLIEGERNAMREKYPDGKEAFENRVQDLRKKGRHDEAEQEKLEWNKQVARSRSSLDFLLKRDACIEGLMSGYVALAGAMILWFATKFSVQFCVGARRKSGNMDIDREYNVEDCYFVDITGSGVYRARDLGRNFESINIPDRVPTYTTSQDYNHVLLNKAKEDDDSDVDSDGDDEDEEDGNENSEAFARLLEAQDAGKDKDDEIVTLGGKGAVRAGGDWRYRFRIHRLFSHGITNMKKEDGTNAFDLESLLQFDLEYPLMNTNDEFVIESSQSSWWCDVDHQLGKSDNGVFQTQICNHRYNTQVEHVRRAAGDRLYLYLTIPY